jgi:hypothetical protein
VPAVAGAAAGAAPIAATAARTVIGAFDGRGGGGWRTGGGPAGCRGRIGGPRAPAFARRSA